MSSRADRLYTADEYLALERASDHKSEFVNGRIYAMTGGSIPHYVIAGNIFGELRNRLRGGPCRAFFEGVRLKVSQPGMYTYADVMAICGAQEVEDSHRDTLLNPVVIFEVLSPSTEAYDRGEKFEHYALLPSLREYILVSQDHVRIEKFLRQGEQWVFTAINDPEGHLRIESLDCEMPVSEIYLDVEFPPVRRIRAND
ncbi:MAG TPA: Uma2 family endonuclease [Longimicrobium sp.]|nr:Uma2 family endonuclease [Longimicrobium sp.]